VFMLNSDSLKNFKKLREISNLKPERSVGDLININKAMTHTKLNTDSDFNKNENKAPETAKLEQLIKERHITPTNLEIESKPIKNFGMHKPSKSIGGNVILSSNIANTASKIFLLRLKR
jgi:hypothetical protein